MKVLDYEHYSWFLLQEGEDFILDVNCNHSFIGYSLVMKLSHEEIARYQTEGRNYLSWLAHEVHYSAPIVNPNSPYKSRDISKDYSQKITDTIVAWRKEQGLD
jgi:hypothetical protein